LYFCGKCEFPHAFPHSAARADLFNKVAHEIREVAALGIALILIAVTVIFVGQSGGPRALTEGMQGWSIIGIAAGMLISIMIAAKIGARISGMAGYQLSRLLFAAIGALVAGGISGFVGYHFGEHVQTGSGRVVSIILLSITGLPVLFILVARRSLAEVTYRLLCQSGDMKD
jgi:hypothetical protein